MGGNNIKFYKLAIVGGNASLCIRVILCFFLMFHAMRVEKRQRDNWSFAGPY